MPITPSRCVCIRWNGGTALKVGKPMIAARTGTGTSNSRESRVSCRTGVTGRRRILGPYAEVNQIRVETRLR